MTILEALGWAQTQLKETTGEKRQMKANPMLDAQVLLAWVLQKPTAFLFAHGEDELPDTHIHQFTRAIARRKRHEPVCHIIGTKPFYGRSFSVNRFVLAPRPETELLVEKTLERIRNTTVVIDIGTGSGAIAITLAAQTQNPVVAIDLDPQALAMARKNAQAHGVSHLISFLHGSLLEPYIEKRIRDRGHGIILANLPYLTPLQWQNADPDVKDYEPKHALVGGIDGLALYDKLFEHIQEHRESLARELELFLEIDPQQAPWIHGLIQDYFPHAEIHIYPDFSGCQRMVHALLEQK